MVVCVLRKLMWTNLPLDIEPSTEFSKKLKISALLFGIVLYTIVETDLGLRVLRKRGEYWISIIGKLNSEKDCWILPS